MKPWIKNVLSKLVFINLNIDILHIWNNSQDITCIIMLKVLLSLNKVMIWNWLLNTVSHILIFLIPSMFIVNNTFSLIKSFFCVFWKECSLFSDVPKTVQAVKTYKGHIIWGKILRIHIEIRDHALLRNVYVKFLKQQYDYLVLQMRTYKYFKYFHSKIIYL